MRFFYSVLLWCTRLELALALSAPNRNYPHIQNLKRDESDYERALIHLELNV